MKKVTEEEQKTKKDTDNQQEVSEDQKEWMKEHLGESVAAANVNAKTPKTFLNKVGEALENAGETIHGASTSAIDVQIEAVREPLDTIHLSHKLEDGEIKENKFTLKEKLNTALNGVKSGGAIFTSFATVAPLTLSGIVGKKIKEKGKELQSNKNT